MLALTVISVLMLLAGIGGLAAVRVAEWCAEREFTAMRAPAKIGKCKSRVCGCAGPGLPMPTADIAEAMTRTLRLRTDVLLGGVR